MSQPPPFHSDHWFLVAPRVVALRHEIAVSRQRFRGRVWMVLHDPVALKTHRVSPAAWAVVARLDGRRSVDEAWREVGDDLGDTAPGQGEVVELLGRLHQADLLRGDELPTVEHLVERRRTQHKPLWRRNMANPLALRWPLWDCDRALRALARITRPLDGWPALGLWLAWLIPAAWLGAQHADELAANLPDRVLAPDSLLLLGAVFLAVKFVHEMAHGLVARLAGVPVHETGLMVLVLAPVPYVDVSAAAALPSKWRRVAVGGAGMAAELVLAAAALYGWLLVEPGPTRAMLFNVMLVAGLSTLVFNGNPLMRFDGYYMLADAIEMPNLAQRSNQWWLHRIRRALGDRDAVEPETVAGERRWLAGYAPLSLAYRLAVMAAIALFVAGEYFFVGVALAVVAIGSAVVMPLLRGLGFLLASPALARVRGRAIARTALAAATLVVAVVAVPLPSRIVAEGVLWVPECAEVRALEDGWVDGVLAANGAAHAAGTPLLRVRSPELGAQHDAQRARVRQLEVRHRAELANDRVAAALTDDTLRHERAALARLDEQAARLTIAGCVDGRLQLDRADDLAGRPVRRGDLIGVVQPGGPPLVRLVVGQDDIGRIRAADHELRVLLVDDVSTVHVATWVREVPAGEFDLPSPALSPAGGGPHAVDPGDESGRRTLARVFQVDVRLADEVSGARVGTRALARFSTPSEPMAVQIGRRVRQLFLSRLDV